jgi:16S rRNA G1207 methylase RsmC
MPTSNYEAISKILGEILVLDPRSVLDVGPGKGKYGVLCREYLNLNKLDCVVQAIDICRKNRKIVRR